MAWNLTTTEDDAKGSVFSTSANINLIAATASDASLRQFQEIYLGALNSDPSVTAYGTSVSEGMLYFNTTNDRLEVHDGSGFVDATPGTTGLTNIDIILNKYDGSTTATSGNNKNIALINTIATGTTGSNANLTIINTVHGSIDDVNTVANIHGDVTTVAGLNSTHLSNVSGAATHITTIGSTPNAIANIGTVAGQISPSNKISTVAGLNTEISNLHSISPDITSVANISTDVSSLADALDKTYTVTVAGGAFVLSGSSKPALTMFRGNTYIFDLSDSSNGLGGTHPLRFSTTSNGTHNSGVAYTTGVTVTGTPGQAGAKVQIELASNAPATLYYYCANHNNMGNTITVKDTTLSLVAGSIDKVTTTADNITNVNTVAAADSNITAIATGNSGNNLSNINTLLTSNSGANLTNINNLNGPNVLTHISNLNGTNVLTHIGNLNGTDVLDNIDNLNAAGVLDNIDNLNDSGVLNNISTLATGYDGSTNTSGTNTNLAQINTAVNNLSGINSFAERYRKGPSDPSSSLDAGDLFYNETSNILKYYNGSAWLNTVEAATATNRASHTVSATEANAGTVTVSVNYIVNNVDIFVNGVRLAAADYTASNGTSVTITGLVENDIIDIIGWSAFNVANALTTTNNLSDLANVGTARTNLGLVIGTDVQANDAGLTSIAGLTTAADKMIYTTGSDTYAVTTLTSTARSLLDDASTSDMRTTLGLGSMATADNNNIALAGNPTTTTQSTSDSSTKIATTAYVNNAITGAGGITQASARLIAQEEATAIAIALG